MATAATIHLARGLARKNPTARVSVSARRSLPERRSSDAAGSFVSTRAGSFLSSSSSYCGDILIGSATLFSSQKCSRPLLRLAQRAHQRKLGYIVLIERLDVVFIGARHCFLRLHHLQASGNAGLVAVLCFLQLLSRKINLLLGHRYLIVRGLYVEQCRTYFKLHAAAQVFQFQPVLPQHRLRLVHVRLCLAALKNRDFHSGGNRIRCFRASRCRPDETGLAVDFKGRKPFAPRGLYRKFSRPHT